MTLRAPHSAFHNFVRGVFAERSVRAALLRANRASWLHRVSRQLSPGTRVTNLYSRD